MHWPGRVRLCVLAALLAIAVPAQAGPPRVLRVCADPNNLPFSSKDAPGFENEIADVLAKELDATVEYTWWAQRRGFFRNTLKAELCDVVIGVPVGLQMVKSTAPYYRSSYVFVTRADRALDLRSLDDERLRTLRIGVQIVGDDGASAPPVHALSARGIVNNVIGYSVYGDYTKDSPPADAVRAVARGEIDVAIVWGPLAGGTARRLRERLRITPVAEVRDHGLPMQFSIGLGVRKPDEALRVELEQAVRARAVDIRKILARWRVPQLPLEATK
jgi:mxaJ protein